MLILSRRPGEAILMDGGVRIVVLGMEGGSVRLGIEAPSSVGIVREEVAQRVAEENIRAGATEDAREWLKSLGPAGGSEEPEESVSEGPSGDSSATERPDDEKEGKEEG